MADTTFTPYVTRITSTWAQDVNDHVYDYGARKDVAQTFTAGQRGAYVALVNSSGSVAIDLDLSNNFNHTLTEDTTLAAPTNATAGQAGIIQFNQHADSPKTMAFNAFWKWPGGTDGTLTAANSAVDIMSYVVDSTGTFATCSMLNDIK
jgi:hypothetical protein